jgi:hypothetical protein
MQDANVEASTKTQHTGSQAAVAMNDVEVDAFVEDTCERCHLNPVLVMKECSECSDHGLHSHLTDEERKLLKARVKGCVREVVGALRFAHATGESEEYTDEADKPKNEIVAPPALILCCECHVGEAFVMGGRCADCVSYPHGRELSPDRQGSRGVRIGGGFDVLQVASDHGRMAAAREAVKQTVRANSPNRVSPFVEDPSMYVHGAPSTYSSPDRYHVGMLPRQAGQVQDNTNLRLPLAGKKKGAIDAEGMMRASLLAMNRDGPSKSFRGEPYLYRVMAPNTCRPEAGVHRPSPRERSTPMPNAFT